MFEVSLKQNDWISLVFISILILLALNNYFNQMRFRHLLQMILNRRYFNIFSRDPELYVSSFNLFFLPVIIMTYGLLLFFALKLYYPGKVEYDFDLYLEISIGIGIFFALKFALGFVFNFIISNVENFKNFSFYALAFRNFSSVYVFVFLVIFYYSFAESLLFMKLGVLVLLLFSLVSYLFSSLKVIGSGRYSLFHIILYLCALEIAPTLIYFKFVKSLIF